MTIEELINLGDIPSTEEEIKAFEQRDNRRQEIYEQQLKQQSINEDVLNKEYC